MASKQNNEQILHEPESEHRDESPESLDESETQRLVLSTWRRVAILTSALAGTFLSILDTAIVAVALATIANKFGDFDQSSWVFTAYMLTYMAFGVVLARLSDTFGLDTIETVSMILFFGFSAACASSRNMTELIIFRAFQGIGGSGLYSIGVLVGIRVLPPAQAHMMAIYVGFTQTVAVVLGPILGGVITQSTTSSSWRWIFWINLPIGGVGLAVFLSLWPRQSSRDKAPVWQQLRSIDFLGAALLLVASVLLIYALEQAGTRHVSWNSSSVIASLTVAGVAFGAFVLWEVLIDSHPRWRLVEIFPVKVFRDRVMSAAIVTTILTSVVWYHTLVNLPDRYQIVHGDGPVKAGLRLLPMLVTSALGIFIAGGLSTKHNRTAYTTIIANAFQIVGYGLMTTIRGMSASLGKTYGFQVLLGLGFGISIASTTMMVLVRYYSRPQILSVAQGSITMMRMLGGALGLAISTIVFNDRIQGSTDLARELSPAQIAHLYKSPLVISTFDAQQQEVVATVYAQAFTSQNWLATYIAAAGLVISLATFEKRPPPMPGAQQKLRPAERGLEATPEAKETKEESSAVS